MWGHGFTAGETVNVTLDGFSGSGVVDEFGDFWVETGVSPVASQLVTVTGTDSGIFRELTVAALTFDLIDYDADVMADTSSLAVVW